jgi:acylglycerol lipase
VQASDNIPMLRALAADPLIIKETRSDTLNGLVDLMGAALAAAPRLTVPTFVLYGAKDEIVPRAPVSRLVVTLPAASRPRQRIALYAHGYHLLLRDLEAPVVVDDVALWMLHPAEPLPSHADQGARAALTGQGELLAAQ